MAITLQQHTYLRKTGSLDILVGIWLIISPFLLGYAGNTTALWNDIISGAAVIIFATIQSSGKGLNTSWPSWINLVIGIWLILSPFALGYSSSDVTMWNETLTGVVIVAIAAFAAFASAPSDSMDDRV